MAEHVVLVKLISNFGSLDSKNENKLVDGGVKFASLVGKFHPWFTDYSVFVGVISGEGNGEALAQNVLDQFHQTFWESDWKDNMFYDEKSIDDMDDPMTHFDYVFHTYRNGERTLFSGYNYRFMGAIEQSDEESYVLGGKQFYVTTGRAISPEEIENNIRRIMAEENRRNSIDGIVENKSIQG